LLLKVYHKTYIATMPFIPKARKKSDADLALLRVKYAKHQFEIKPNLFLTIDTYNELADAFNEAAQKGKQQFRFKGHTLTTDYAAFCLHRYDNIDPSFDEEMLAYYAKQAEQRDKNAKNEN